MHLHFITPIFYTFLCIRERDELIFSFVRNYEKEIRGFKKVEVPPHTYLSNWYTYEPLGRNLVLIRTRMFALLPFSSAFSLAASSSSILGLSPSFSWLFFNSMPSQISYEKKDYYLGKSLNHLLM